MQHTYERSFTLSDFNFDVWSKAEEYMYFSSWFLLIFGFLFFIISITLHSGDPAEAHNRHHNTNLCFQADLYIGLQVGCFRCMHSAWFLRKGDVYTKTKWTCGKSKKSNNSKLLYLTYYCMFSSYYAAGTIVNRQFKFLAACIFWMKARTAQTLA